MSGGVTAAMIRDQAGRMEKAIAEKWSPDGKGFRVGDYEVRFTVRVRPATERSGALAAGDNEIDYNPSETTSFVQPFESKTTTGGVTKEHREANTGTWRSYESAAHETGHLFGLEDRYHDRYDMKNERMESEAQEGWESNLMAISSLGEVDERNLRPIVEAVKQDVKAQGAKNSYTGMLDLARVRFLDTAQEQPPAERTWIYVGEPKQESQE